MIFTGLQSLTRFRTNFSRLIRSATFDGQEDTAIAVQQAIQNGVFLGGLGKLKQALSQTQSA